MGLSSTLSNCILKTSSDGDSTASLGRLFQWMIVLTVKKNKQYLSCVEVKPLSWCNLYPLPLVFSMWLLVKREPPSSL